MPRAEISSLSLPMTPEEDLVLRVIHVFHTQHKLVALTDLYRDLEPYGVGRFEIRLCLGSLKDCGYVEEIKGKCIYYLTGDGLHHVNTVPPIKDSPTNMMLRAALVVGVLIWTGEAFTGIEAFGDVGSLMVSLSVAASITVSVYRWFLSLKQR